MKRFYTPGRSGIAATFGLLTTGCLPAIAQQTTTQERFGPDQLQTLGVGSRAVAMGDAFAAIADDASASFWNPGRLSFLENYSQTMFSYRTVENSFAKNSTFTQNDIGFQPGKPQLGFASFIYPLKNKKGRSLGILSASYTLGGYFSEDRTQESLATDGAGNLITNSSGKNIPFLSSATHTVIRNSFLTLAYGTKLSARAGFGIGVFFVNQDFNKNSTLNTFNPADPKNPFQSPNTASERGRGYGANVGFYYGIPKPRLKTPLKEGEYDTGILYSFGLAYRTQTHLSGLGAQGEGFNEEIPGRLSVGIARDQDLRSYFDRKAVVDGRPVFDRVPDHLITSLEFQVLQAANRSYDAAGNLKLQDARRAVGNVHFGLEYTPGKLHKRGAYKVPLRLGVRTNANAAYKYSYYDTVFSFGTAFITEGANAKHYSIEPTFEVLTRTGAFDFTLTGQIVF